jgi:hypothetical protein
MQLLHYEKKAQLLKLKNYHFWPKNHMSQLTTYFLPSLPLSNVHKPPTPLIAHALADGERKPQHAG